MLAIIAEFAWNLIRYNNFQLPIAAWHLLSSGSA